MTNLKKTEQKNKEKETYQLLKEIKEMIKTPVLRKKGFKMLMDIEVGRLSVTDQIFYYYIEGKYYVLTFKDSKHEDLVLLEKGNDCYTDMVAVAYENNLPIKNPKRHYARAYCKYLIALHSSEEVKMKLFRKVKQISGRVLCHQPENGSFLWLIKKIDG